MGLTLYYKNLFSIWATNFYARTLALPMKPFCLTFDTIQTFFQLIDFGVKFVATCVPFM
jgi:hypothetical protein